MNSPTSPDWSWRFINVFCACQEGFWCKASSINQLFDFGVYTLWFLNVYKMKTLSFHSWVWGRHWRAATQRLSESPATVELNSRRAHSLAESQNELFWAAALSTLVARHLHTPSASKPNWKEGVFHGEALLPHVCVEYTARLVVSHVHWCELLTDKEVETLVPSLSR